MVVVRMTSVDSIRLFGSWQGRGDTESEDAERGKALGVSGSEEAGLRKDRDRGLSFPIWKVDRDLDLAAEFPGVINQE